VAKFNQAKLQKRALSAAILGPFTLAIMYFGGLAFQIFLMAAFILASFEWYQMALKSKLRVFLILLGMLYVTTTFFAFYEIRMTYSMMMMFLLLFMVWASDIGAYFAGKFIGGPKMAVTISPNKTWAGMMGAILGPALVGLWYSTFDLSPQFSWQALMMLGGVIGIVGQAGDLLISAFKRHVNVKDTGHVIPGHGGLLDRIDSLMLSTPVFLAFLMEYAHGPSS
jgi:phosphatidate cytidylyltransferase